MKKMYMIAIVLATTGLAWCTLKGPIIPQLSTGDTQLSTGIQTELTGEMGTWTTNIDSGVVPMMSGSEDVAAQQSGIMAEVKETTSECEFQSSGNGTQPLFFPDLRKTASFWYFNARNSSPILPTTFLKLLSA